MESTRKLNQHDVILYWTFYQPWARMWRQWLKLDNRSGYTYPRSSWYFSRGDDNALAKATILSKPSPDVMWQRTTITQGSHTLQYTLLAWIFRKKIYLSLSLSLSLLLLIKYETNYQYLLYIYSYKWFNC